MGALKRLMLRAWVILVAAIPTTASAAWPERIITLVAPFPAGGNADAVARILADGLQPILGQPVIVENRPGAGGMSGSSSVAKSRPDGYTFLLGALANVLNEHLYKQKPFDLRKDLAPVSQVVSVPNYFAATPGLGINTLADLVARAKAKPGQLTCATSGAGTSGHIACEMFKRGADVNVLIVPYRGGAPAITDVMAGHTDFLAVNEALPFIRDNRLKGLAITSPDRSPLAPELPPAAETIRGFNLVSWYGVFAPAGTPPEIVAKVSTAIAATLKSQQSRDRLTILGATPVESSPKEFEDFLAQESVRWETIIKEMSIALD
jgi:tripartite-type tricarboxylate transporter receptor subunit TctC